MSLLVDESQVRLFIEKCLPSPCPDGHSLVVWMAQRKKYGAVSSSRMLDRLSFRDVEDLVQFLCRPIPPNTRADYLVIYCLLNPRDQYDAFRSLVNQVLTMNPKELNNLTSLAEGLVSAAKHIERSWELDFDTKNPAQCTELSLWLEESKLSENLLAMIETRGGYHVVFGVLSKDQRREIYLWVKDRPWVTLKRDPAPPIPGTLQGGFPVRMVDWKNLTAI